MESSRRIGGVGARLVAGAGGVARSGAVCSPPVRVVEHGSMATRSARRALRGSAVGRSHGHARALDPAGVDCGVTTLEPRQPALCINRSEQRRPGTLPGAKRAAEPLRWPPFRVARVALRTGGPLTTDRLVTPFHASRAQSGPRKVSPMNFTRGSRSIQRLLAARPLLTCWSRGRA
jgi:hypothetical protein